MTKTKKSFSIYRLIPLVILLIALGLFFYFKLYRFISFTALQQHHEVLIHWTKANLLLVSLIYLGVYIVMTAISVPGAAIMSITGGFLFGIYLGTLYIIISATIGAIIIFMAAKTAFAELLLTKAGPLVKQMEKGFQENAMSYLLFLRFIPIFPFWLVNIVPALLNVRLRIFIIATFIGIIPGSLVYASLGNGLGTILSSEQTTDLHILFKPSILWPLVGLAVLSLIPVIYKRVKKRRGTKHA